MDARYYPTLERYLRKGDRAVVYVQGGRFIAVIEFTGGHEFDERDLGWTKGGRSFLFPYRVPFRILHESKDRPRISFSVEEEDNQARWVRPNFIDEVTFITDKGRTWNQFLQVSLIRLTKEDFDTISGAIQGG